MIDPAETFDGTYPFEPHYVVSSGVRMHHVDEGDGDPVLLLHGEPTWSYLYRDIIPGLAERHRVIAPDFIGFGKSATPETFPYTPQSQSEALEALILALDLWNLTLVLHDWGGPIGGAVALRHPERVSRLVLMNTLLPLGLPAEADCSAAIVGETAYFRWMRHLHDSDVMDTVLGEFGTIIPAVMKGLQGVERAIDETWMRAYGAPFATPGACAGAIALPKSIVTDTFVPEPASDAAVATLRRTPAMMIYGMKDRVLLPHHLIPAFEAQFSGAPVYRLAHAGHFLQEDAPETVTVLIDQFIRMSGGADA